MKFPQDFLRVSKRLLLSSGTRHLTGSTLLSLAAPLSSNQRIYCSLCFSLRKRTAVFFQPQKLGPPSFCHICLLPLSPEFEEQSMGVQTHSLGSVTSSWHRILLLSSLVPHFPHTSAALDGGHFHCFYHCKKHLNEHLWCPGSCICHWGYSTELCRYGPSSHEHPTQKINMDTKQGHLTMNCYVGWLYWWGKNSFR